MKTVTIYRLDTLSSTLFQRLKAAQLEAARAWNTCCERHKNARQQHTQWPGQNEMHQVTRGRFALHSQSVQAIFRAFLAPIDTTRQLRKAHPMMRMKYPWRLIRFYPVSGPAQAVSKERGRKSLILPIEPPSVNMHTLAYGSHVMFPRSFTYLRPSTARRRSKADTPQRCLSKSTGQPLLDRPHRRSRSEARHPLGDGSITK